MVFALVAAQKKRWFDNIRSDLDILRLSTSVSKQPSKQATLIKNYGQQKCAPFAFAI